MLATCSTTRKDLSRVNLHEIAEAFATTGRLTEHQKTALRVALRGPANPFTAITTAADCGAAVLAGDILPHLTHADPMVRWNAAGVLFTRFRIAAFAAKCLQMVDTEPDEEVRAIAICGLGELLPRVENVVLRNEMANRLCAILSDKNELTEMRGAAYEGIQAAMATPPLERLPATRLINLERDVDARVVAAFREKFT